jgi:hypothetical protein
VPDNEVKVVITGQNDASPAIHEASEQLENLAAVGERLKSVFEAYIGTEIISRLAELGASAIETGANMAEMAERTGINAEELQALAFAAQQSGVSTDTFERGVRKLQATLTQAAEGNAKAAAALAAVGVSARNSSGGLTTAGQALDKIAQKFKSTADGTAKAGLAIQIFGRSGTSMIPMLNQGSDGLEALEKRAKDLGLVLSGEDLEALKDVSHAFAETKATSVALMEHLVAGLAPALESTANALSEQFAAQMGVATQAGMGLVNMLKAAITLVDAFAIDVEWAGEKVAKQWEIMGDAAALHFGKAFHDALQFTGIENDPQAQAINDSFRKFFETMWSGATAQVKGSNDLTDLVVEAADKSKEITKELLEYQLAAIKAGETALKAANEREEQENENLYKHNLKSVDDYYKAKKQLAVDEIQIEMYALEQEGRLYDQALGALTGLHPAEVARVQALLQQGKLDDAALARMPKIKASLSEIVEVMTKQMQVATQLDTLQKKLNAAQDLTPSGQVDSLARLADSEDIAAAKAKLLGDAIQATFDKIKDQTDLVKQKMETFAIGGIEGQKELNAVLKQGSQQLQTMIADYQKLAAAAGDPRLVTEGQKFETQLDQMNLKVHTLAQTLAQEGTQNIENFLGAIEKAPNAAKAFEQFGMSILEMLAKIINQMIATWIIEKAIGIAGGIGGAAGGGGGATSIGSDINPAPTNSAGVLGTVPGFAEGGEPPVGEPSVVGEEGMELFVPHVAGTIVPHEETMRRLTASAAAPLPEASPEFMGDFMERMAHMSSSLDHSADALVAHLQTSAPGVVSRLDPSGLFGVHAIPHALGGDMDPGDVGLVGDAGPELFVPDTPGRVIPNNLVGDALSGGGGDVHNHMNIDARGANAETEMHLRRYVDQAMDRWSAITRVQIRENGLRRNRR